MIPAWGWLMIVMAVEAALMLWFSFKTYGWGYEEGMDAMRTAMNEELEKKKKERSR